VTNERHAELCFSGVGWVLMASYGVIVRVVLSQVRGKGWFRMRVSTSARVVHRGMRRGFKSISDANRLYAYMCIISEHCFILNDASSQ
jgi:hypothetical protein